MNEKLRSRILRLHRITDGNSSETSRRLKSAGYSTMQQTVCVIWRSEGYEPKKAGTGRSNNLKIAIVDKRGIELIVRLYDRLKRDPHRVKSALEREGYHASRSEIVRYWTMVKAYDRYDQRPGLAAQALGEGYNRDQIKKCWGLLGLPMNGIKIQPQSSLEEKL